MIRVRSSGRTLDWTLQVVSDAGWAWEAVPAPRRYTALVKLGRAVTQTPGVSSEAPPHSAIAFIQRPGPPSTHYTHQTLIAQADRQAAAMPPKPILKNSTSSSNIPERKVNPRHLQIALHHANIIEQQKRIENEILESILELMEYPPSPDADPQRPEPSNARHFCEAIQPFRPADYDDLIEERNIADKCGYVLCPRPKKKAPSRARKQMIWTPNGPEVVDRKQLEVWCSEDCARRALYVKVQLNEEPAWLRQGGAAPPIELLVENQEEHDRARRMALPLRPKSAPKTEERSEEDAIAEAWAARDEALALERGEQPRGPTKANEGLIKAEIEERAPGAPPVAPTKDSSQSHMAIEGHVPQERTKASENAEEDEEDAQDWDKHLPG